MLRSVLPRRQTSGRRKVSPRTVKGVLGNVRLTHEHRAEMMASETRRRSRSAMPGRARATPRRTRTSLDGRPGMFFCMPSLRQLLLFAANLTAAGSGSQRLYCRRADQTRKRNREAVRNGRWNAVPISNYRRLDEWPAW